VPGAIWSLGKTLVDNGCRGARLSGNSGRAAIESA
jgi:hypothetical protein